MRDDLRRMALFGSGVAELTVQRAEQLAKDLLERSKQNRDDLLNLVRSEIRNQLTALGVATKRDLERVERRVARLEGAGARSAGTRSTAGARKKTTSTRRSTQTKPVAKTDPTDHGS
jgi:polyhydroxyalkanoate synthesis regulator phasin